MNRLVDTKMVNNIVLKLKQGQIIGEKVTFPSGRNHYKFFGIPYAKPPIGELRFKSPQSFEKFPEDPLECKTEKCVSLQMEHVEKRIIGDEDCLYLNIHSPCIGGDNLLPVMVYIHGGAFLTGSGNKHVSYPKYILENDVILVTINYRLGMFGFLSFPSGGISGNYGLKDQLLALQWIHENIQSFNGDPNNITLFGHSAGAASVNFHLFSSKSKKYFHRAIMQSGSAIHEWSIENNPEAKALKLAEYFKFEGTPLEIANSFRNIENPMESFKYMLKIFSEDEKKRILMLPFKPVIESEDSDDPFITKHPLELIKINDIYDNISIMTGYTTKEGIIIFGYTPKTIDEIENDLISVLPVSLIDHIKNSPKSNFNTLKDIKNYYINGNKFDSENINALAELLGDSVFVLHSYWLQELHMKYQSKSPLYCYKFSYNGNLNINKKRYSGDKNIDGVCHGDELYYLFYPSDDNKKQLATDNDIKFISKFCKLWTNFAKYNNPTPDNQKNNNDDNNDVDDDNLINFKWEPIQIQEKFDEKKYEFNVMNINENFELFINPDETKILFWKALSDKNNSEILK